MKFIKCTVIAILFTLIGSAAGASNILQPQGLDWLNEQNWDLARTQGIFLGTTDDKSYDGQWPLRGATNAHEVGVGFIPYAAMHGQWGSRGPEDGVRTPEEIGVNIGYWGTLGRNIENVILYLGGHGSNNIVRLEEDPVTNINADQLKEYLGLIPSEINKWVFIDSCRSGSFINELNDLENISILTSAKSSKNSLYTEDGRSIFASGLTDFLSSKNGQAFDFDELTEHMLGGNWLTRFIGQRVYISEDEVIYDEPHFFTLDDWNIDFYESPTYNAAPVPEPNTMLLFGVGLVGLVWYRRKRI